VLSPSLIDTAPLILARFDLVPMLLVLAAVLARDRGRSATWSALLSAGAAVKAFPLLLYPVLLRGETRLRRVIVAGAVPLLLCAVAVLVMGDEFGSAISYHTERALQIEAVAASPFEVAHALGASGVSSTVGHGGFELSSSGADLARWISVVLGAAAYLWLTVAGWRSEISNLKLATALLAVMVTFAPVLSPQFLLWILPVSACAYGLGRENLVLLLAVLFTQIALQHYDGVGSLRGDFVWPLAARNVYVLVYLGLVAWPLVREGFPASPSGRGKRPPGRTLLSEGHSPERSCDAAARGRDFVGGR
jgi:Glycosyltransferase family 87